MPITFFPIRRLRTQEKIKLWNNLIHPDLDKTSHTIDYVAEYKFSVIKGEDDNHQSDFRHRTTSVFSSVVTLFRLIKINLAIYDEYTVSILDIPVGSAPSNLFVSALGVTYGGNVFVDSITLLKFADLWTEFGVVLSDKVLDFRRYFGDPFSNLKIAIARFNYAYERKQGIDSFIDNIVALEALFSKEDDDFRRTTERLSKRIAIFLETDPHKRKEIFCEMIRLYYSRGKIIHGGYTDEINIITTRNYLIKSFLKYFEFLKQDNFSHIEFIRSLDLESEKFSMKRKHCKQKKIHNNDHVYSIPDFLFSNSQY